MKYIIGFAVVFIISYVLASPEMADVGKAKVTESTSKWVGTGLYAFYILGIGTILSIVYSGVKGIFSK